MKEEMKELLTDVIKMVAEAMHTRLSKDMDEIYKLELIRSYAPLLESLAKTIRQVDGSGKTPPRR